MLHYGRETAKDVKGEGLTAPKYLGTVKHQNEAKHAVWNMPGGLLCWAAWDVLFFRVSFFSEIS